MTEPTAADARSAGALLRAAREKQGLHIAALAAAIKVTQRKLEALEGDRFDELPDATFTRALAQTVCRQLKIDPKPVLELLPPAAPVELDTTSGALNAPFRERPGREDPALSTVALRPLALGAALLVVAAAAVYFMPPGLFNRAGPAPATSTVVQPVMPPPVAEASASAPAETPLPVAAVAPEPPASAAGGTAEAAASAPPLVLAGNTPASPAAAPAVPVPSASAPGVVQLSSSAASWVEARDARGQVLLFRTVQAGESVGLNGALPIRLTIGNAAATQVALRGKPVDLAPRTRDNVARVELQ